MGEWRPRIDGPPHLISLNKFFASSFVGCYENRVVKYLGEDGGVPHKVRKRLERVLLVSKKISKEDRLVGVLTDCGEGQNMDQVISSLEKGPTRVELDGEMYHQLEPYLVEVSTKYKSVDKKVKPVVIPLPKDARVCWRKLS